MRSCQKINAWSCPYSPFRAPQAPSYELSTTKQIKHWETAHWDQVTLLSNSRPVIYTVSKLRYDTLPIAKRKTIIIKNVFICPFPFFLFTFLTTLSRIWNQIAYMFLKIQNIIIWTLYSCHQPTPKIKSIKINQSVCVTLMMVNYTIGF